MPRLPLSLRPPLTPPCRPRVRLPARRPALQQVSPTPLWWPPCARAPMEAAAPHAPTARALAMHARHAGHAGAAHASAAAAADVPARRAPVDPAFAQAAARYPAGAALMLLALDAALWALNGGGEHEDIYRGLRHIDAVSPAHIVADALAIQAEGVSADRAGLLAAAGATRSVSWSSLRAAIMSQDDHNAAIVYFGAFDVLSDDVLENGPVELRGHAMLRSPSLVALRFCLPVERTARAQAVDAAVGRLRDVVGLIFSNVQSAPQAPIWNVRASNADRI